VLVNSHSKRIWSAISLAAAMVLSLSSTLLITALCPHLQPELMQCIAQPGEKSMSHHNSGHEHGHGLVLSAKGIAGRLAVGVPEKECTHCALHSSPISNLATLRGRAAAQRTYDMTIPVLGTSPVYPTISPITIVPSRAHGPPGEQTSYILINILRI
jgi:hypothetical protein